MTQTQLSSHFLFCVCQVGAEAALKNEIAHNYPELRLAYSRPGFLTFKRGAGLFTVNQKIELRSVFARAFGLSLSRLDQRLGAESEWARHILETAQQLSVESGSRAVRLHLWERDRYKPGEEPKDYQKGLLEERVLQLLKKEAGDRFEGIFLPGPRAELGDAVLDVVIVEENEWWVGTHVHAPEHAPYPGGDPRVQLPAEAPSRAYIKLEEAILWSGLPVRKGDVAVEVGSAPGGACYALLKRGLRVVGIDPGEMAPVVLRYRQDGAEYKHIGRSVVEVSRSDLPKEVHWLLLDMNADPNIALSLVARVAAGLADSLLGVIFTLKLNRWEMADQIPGWLDQIRDMGMARGMAKIRAMQLASNRQEICVVGLTRRGSLRR